MIVQRIRSVTHSFNGNYSAGLNLPKFFPCAFKKSEPIKPFLPGPLYELSPISCGAREIGFALRMQIDRLEKKRAEDPQVARILDGLNRMLTIPQEEPKTGLVGELLQFDSISRNVLVAFLEWVAHRGAKPNPEPVEDQKERSVLSSALLRTRVAGIVDCIIERLVTGNISIPAPMAKNLVGLFEGGADRIQTRANTWMLNEHLPTLYDTERVLLSDASLDPQSLFSVVDKLSAIDGATSMGFQKPHKPAEKRLVTMGYIEREMLPAWPNGVAVPQVEAGFVSQERRASVINILQQSPDTASSLAIIEEHLHSLNPNLEEFQECLEVYRAYTKVILYVPNKLWSNPGIIDRLAKVVVTTGGKRHREDFVAFLYEGIDDIRRFIFQDCRRQQVSLHDVYFALVNFVLSREHWNIKILDFVMAKIAWLKGSNAPKHSDATALEKAYFEVIAMRRQECPNSLEIRNIIEQKNSEPTPARLGPYRMHLAVKKQTADGEIGMVLEIRDLTTDLRGDTEFSFTLEILKGLAKTAGCIAVQLADWRNIHQARDFRAARNCREFPPLVGEDVIPTTNQLPTFIFPLSIQPNFDALNQFLGSRHSRTRITFEGFSISFRKQTVSGIGKKTLTVTTIKSDTPGSGRYPDLLLRIKEEARRNGYDSLMIEGVTEPRHFVFYEEKMGFSRAPKDHDYLRTYYTTFEK